jgi:hypothetical protein
VQRRQSGAAGLKFLLHERFWPNSGVQEIQRMSFGKIAASIAEVLIKKNRKIGRRR